MQQRVYTILYTSVARGGEEDRQTAARGTSGSSGTRIEQVHNHLAVHIHIERRELGRFSLVYNQFRVTTRGGVNVVGAPGCGRGCRERIHGVYSTAARVQRRS